jgi:hypothetical protein
MHSSRTTNAHDFGCSVRHGFFHLDLRRRAARQNLINVTPDIPLLNRLEMTGNESPRDDSSCKARRILE